LKYPVSNSDYKGTNYLDNKLETIWKEVAVVEFKELSWNLPAGTKKTCKNSGRIAGAPAEVFFTGTLLI
jgi:hypothetical protein